MARTCVALVCLLLVGDIAPADEPPAPANAPSDIDRVFAKLDPALEKLIRARRKVEFVRGGAEKQLDGTALAVMKARLLDAARDVEKARADLRAAVVELRIAALKNAVAGGVRDRWAVRFAKAADDLQTCLGDRDPNGAPLLTAAERLAALHAAFEKDGTASATALTDADLAVHAAGRAAVNIADELYSLWAAERLLGTLREIKQRQEMIRGQIKADFDARVPALLAKEPVLRPAEPLVLERRGKVVVTQQLEWGQYEKDDLEVKVIASDPSLTVPATLKLEFEKHTFRFEYEVKAGEKAGDFTITLTPAAGKPVTVKVTVK